MEEVAVLDHHRDGRADRPAVTDARENFHLIALDLHAPTAAIALLPTPEFVVDGGLVDGHPRGQALGYDDEGLTM